MEYLFIKPSASVNKLQAGKYQQVSEQRYRKNKEAIQIIRLSNWHNYSQIYQKNKETVQGIWPKADKISNRPEKQDGKSSKQEWM